MLRLGLCVFMAAWLVFSEMGLSQPVAQPRVVARVEIPAAEIRGHSVDERSFGACFSPNVAMLTVCCGQKIKVWEVPSGRELIELPGHAVQAVAARFSPDGAMFVSIDSEETVRIWRVSAEDWQLIDEIEPGDLPPRAEGARKVRAGPSLHGWTPAFSPDGRLLAWASRPFHREDRVRVWDLEGRAEVAVLPVDGLVHLLSFSSDGELLKAIVISRVRAKDVHEIWQWSTSSFQRQKRKTPRYDFSFRHLGEKTFAPTSFSPDGELRVERRMTGEFLRITDLTTGRSGVYPGFPPLSPELKIRLAQAGHPGAGNSVVSSMSVSPDKGTVAIGMILSGSVVLWDVATGGPRARLDDPVPGAACALANAFSPDGRYLFTVSFHPARALAQSDAGAGWRRVGYVWDLQGESGAPVYRP